MRPSNVFEVFEEEKGKKKLIYTESIAPGTKVYDEDVVRIGGVEYRNWNPRRSKLGAAITKGAHNVGIRKNNVILYLGAATGTTVSHCSDMVGKDGFIYAVDFAPRVMRGLMSVCSKRQNIAPILADANHPESYARRMSQVDVLYQDVAQKNQVEIFVKNARMFLKPEGYALLAVKARSIDVTKVPQDVFRQVRSELEKHMKIIDFRDLYPFEMDHAFVVCKNVPADAPSKSQINAAGDGGAADAAQPREMRASPQAQPQISTPEKGSTKQDARRPDRNNASSYGSRHQERRDGNSEAGSNTSKRELPGRHGSERGSYRPARHTGYHKNI